MLTHWKMLWCWNVEGKWTREQQRMWWLESIINPTDMNLSKVREIVEDKGAWRAAVHRVLKSRTRLSDSTTTIMLSNIHSIEEYLFLLTFLAFKLLSFTWHLYSSLYYNLETLFYCSVKISLFYILFVLSSIIPKAGYVGHLALAFVH